MVHVTFKNPFPIIAPLGTSPKPFPHTCPHGFFPPSLLPSPLLQLFLCRLTWPLSCHALPLPLPPLVYYFGPVPQGRTWELAQQENSSP